jgi:hypothetical protein
MTRSSASVQLRYAELADATPDGELHVLANVYRFVIDCHAKKEAAPRLGRPDDARKDQDAGTHTHCT